MAIIRPLIILLLLLASLLADAEEEQLQLIGLFKNAAMVDFNGQQKLYRIGQNISPNIKLTKADSHTATFIINGKSQTLELNKLSSFNATVIPDELGGNAANRSATILVGGHGMFMSGGFINGVAVTFMVDTGATLVSMNESVAQQVGLLYQQYGQRGSASTAAGVVDVWSINLNKVKVGGIELLNVPGMVIKGTGPDQVLLGMSFLSRVKMQNDGRLLEMEQKY